MIVLAWFPYFICTWLADFAARRTQSFVKRLAGKNVNQYFASVKKFKEFVIY